MKTFRHVVLFLFGIFFIFQFVSAQSVTYGIWHFQNPNSRSLNATLIFMKNNEFNYLGVDMKTAQTIEHKGTYKVSGDVLHLFFSSDQSEAIYQITWEGKEKLILSNDKEYLIFATLGSPKDVFLNNYFLQEQIQIQNDSRARQQEWNQRKYETEVCKTCFGTGSCKVCGGTGTYSAYGYSSVCKACGGTGKCWHCKGSRLQNR